MHNHTVQLRLRSNKVKLGCPVPLKRLAVQGREGEKQHQEVESNSMRLAASPLGWGQPWVSRPPNTLVQHQGSRQQLGSLQGI